MTAFSPILQAETEVLSTLKRDGSRRWMFPRLAKGRFLSARRWTAYGLIAFFSVLPFVRVNGKPCVLLDVLARRFTLFGFTFLPTDTILLALLLVSVILAIFAMTALLGRVWCGWACPQTVYMEFVYRPIERLCLGKRGVGGKPKANIAAWRYAVMYAAFFAVSLWLANVFLAYFVGVERLKHWVTGSPAEHWPAFLIVAAVTSLMMFDFAFFREQTCLIACPYGRFQSVLLDRHSLIISYDTQRGEPRAKLARPAAGKTVTERTAAVSTAREPLSLAVLPNEAAIESHAKQPSSTHGDCIDCNLCVSVCPTGIDIRNGLQFECIGCAQCIDACDAVMQKIHRPLGLIRYGSQAGMAGHSTRLLRPRTIIYPVLLICLVGLMLSLLILRSPADVTLLRGYGKPFVMTPAGEVENVMRVKITNRTEKSASYRIISDQRSVIRVAPSQESIVVAAGESWVEPVQVFAQPKAFRAGVLDVTLRVAGPDGLSIDLPCRLLGPTAGGSTP